MKRKILILAGPTASGKSRLALETAKRFDGVVINADSMQVYDGLRLLTARPDAAALAQAPHRLYGILPPDAVCSAGRWRTLAIEAIDEVWQQGKLPIVAGGTGLYLYTLVNGISPIPDIPDTVRDASRHLFEQDGNAAFHARLAARDPIMAARLHPSNSQRLVRAWEVIEATGRSLADWQAQPLEGGLDADVFKYALLPPRADLFAACDRRFLEMMQEGALDEVEALLARNLDPALPLMKALGVEPLRDYLSGLMSEAAAVRAAQTATRQYAKRQITWIKGKFSDYKIDSEKFSESIMAKFFSKVEGFLLTEPE